MRPMVRSVWSRLFGRESETRRLKPSGKRSASRKTTRPAVEPLEGRLAPAVLTVNSAADLDARDTVLTLREAISVTSQPAELFSFRFSSLSPAEQDQIDLGASPE